MGGNYTKVSVTTNHVCIITMQSIFCVTMSNSVLSVSKAVCETTAICSGE